MIERAKEAIDAFHKAVYDLAIIIMANPDDVSMFTCDMFPKHYEGSIYLYGNRYIEKGTFYILDKDSETKRYMYDLIKEHPECVRSLKGTEE